MRTRTAKGCYSSHNTPGDGTGFTHFPPMEPYDVLGTADQSSPNSEHTNATRESVIVDRPARGKQKE